MLQAEVKKYRLHFKRPAGTSRGVYQWRDSWFIMLWDSEQAAVKAYGECAPLPDLSCDLDANYEEKIREVCAAINDLDFWLNEGLIDYPSIRFGLETAWLDYKRKGQHLLFDTPFTRGDEGLLINGLIWMGEASFMREQIQHKLSQGFQCIKLKIGANAIEEELQILEAIRHDFSAEKLELRVDANGAFSPQQVMPVLERLALLDIHSIEQPIRQGQMEEMRYLCQNSPLPIALDEELIGINHLADKTALIANLQPQYLILKPSLHGGMAGCQEWIDLARKHNVAWWITSALESNIGLNAIAQWASSLSVIIPQGLGTGQLFTNNFESPLQIRGDRLYYSSPQEWNIADLRHD